eukprot:245382_1
MVQLWISFVALFILLRVMPSQQVIDGVWMDDFEHDDSKLTGWQIENTLTGDLGNPTIQGNAYKFHGPFASEKDIYFNYLYRYFSCNKRSTVSLSFYYAFCDTTEDSDWVRVGFNDTFSPQFNMMEQEGGTKLASIETGDTFQNALPNDILSSCDEKNDWWYKTVSDYWAGSVERGTPFLITFTGKTSNEKEYFALFNLEIKCVALPTAQPTQEPTINPTHMPTLPPTASSKTPTASPSSVPTLSPSNHPTDSPSQIPSNSPSITPSIPPTLFPTISPSNAPTIAPSWQPSISPSLIPSMFPTLSPTVSPTLNPTLIPSLNPTLSPSNTPSYSPSQSPTLNPTLSPSNTPSYSPSQFPTLNPTLAPSVHPSLTPTIFPSMIPSTSPTLTPSAVPTLAPSLTPSITPSNAPSIAPTELPSAFPTQIPSYTPSTAPSIAPSLSPTDTPTFSPSMAPTANPLYMTHYEYMTCLSLENSMELLYDLSQSECIAYCLYESPECQMINHYSHFRVQNDARCYLYDKQCVLSSSVTSNNPSSTVWFTQALDFDTNCTNFPVGWKDKVGDSCPMYEAFGLCDNHSMKTTNDYSNANGVVASEACCECSTYAGLHSVDNIEYVYRHTWPSINDELTCLWKSKETDVQYRNYDNVLLWEWCNNLHLKYNFHNLSCLSLMDNALFTVISVNLYVCDHRIDDALPYFMFVSATNAQSVPVNVFINVEWFQINNDVLPGIVSVQTVSYESCAQRINTLSSSHQIHGIFPCYLLNQITLTTEAPNITLTLTSDLSSEGFESDDNKHQIATISIIFIGVSALCCILIALYLFCRKKNVKRSVINDREGTETTCLKNKETFPENVTYDDRLGEVHMNDDLDDNVPSESTETQYL